MVVSVAIHPEQNDVMVSCSEDGRVVMWDLRMPKPALGIFLLMHLFYFPFN
jgi:hypothetical protein